MMANFVDLYSQYGSGSTMNTDPSWFWIRVHNTSVAEPEPIFLGVGAGSRSSGSGCIFLASKKEKPCSCVKHDIKGSLEW